MQKAKHNYNCDILITIIMAARQMACCMLAMLNYSNKAAYAICMAAHKDIIFFFKTCMVRDQMKPVQKNMVTNCVE